jgi:hypothetical protein
MSKTRIFIYGSCVSRDTFEYFDREQFALVQYVARQSALSAYSRPVDLVAPPTLGSRFQQRMVTGDFMSNLRDQLAAAADMIDLVLVDLTDERLGIHLLPDGSVVTRSPELISSGAEEHLPAGTRHLPFGDPLHFEYWSAAISWVGNLFRQVVPHAAVALLDIPWAERSESGAPSPDSFGITARDANPLFARYLAAAAGALDATVIRLEPQDAVSSPTHPWGEAPFHYAASVYRNVVDQITSAAGGGVSPGAVTADSTGGSMRDGPNLLLAGAQRAGTQWLHRQLAHHPDIFMAPMGVGNYFDRPNRLSSESETSTYLARFDEGRGRRWRGERTPGYFWHTEGGPFSPNRTHDTAAAVRERLGADVTVMLSLRDPVSRAVSAFWSHFAQGHLDLTAGLFRASPTYGIVDRGFYRRHYAHWANTLGEEHLRVLLYDDLVTEPRQYLSEALDMLGLSDSSGFWDSVELRVTPGRWAWLDPVRRRHPIQAQEIAALHELYRGEVEFVEDLLERELPEWRDLDALIAKHTSGK